MFIFNVRDMSGHESAVAIVKAVRHADEGASAFVDLEHHSVEITPDVAGASILSEAISRAGFTPVLITDCRDSPRSRETFDPHFLDDHGLGASPLH